MPVLHIKPPPAVPAYAPGLAKLPRASMAVIAIEAPPGPQALAAILAIVVRRFTPFTISSVQRPETQHIVVTIDGSRLDRSLSLLRKLAMSKHVASVRLRAAQDEPFAGER